MMQSNEVRWCVEEQDTGLPVANGVAPTEKAAHTEMMHYVIQYAQDGPVRFWMRQNRKTLINGSMAGLSIKLSLKA